MSKRLFLGIIALSALPLLRTEANAATCISWRNIGGSNCCTKWSTSSILIEVTFNQDCGPGGEGCSAGISATTSNSIAFCRSPFHPELEPIKVPCTDTVTFAGQANGCDLQTAQTAQVCSAEGQFCPNGKSDCCPGLQCVDNSATDHTKVCKVGSGGGGGGGGGSGETCISTTEIFPPAGSCSAVCPSGTEVVDVVPIGMDTHLDLTVPGSPAAAATETTAASSFECPSFSSTCTIIEHCEIDPRKIQFEDIRDYQCTVTFAGSPG